MNEDNKPAETETTESAPAQSLDKVFQESQKNLASNIDKPLKKKPGRPKKNVQAAPTAIDAAEMPPVAPMAPPPDYAPMLKDLATMGSGMLVENLGPAAALTPEEQDRIAIGCNPLMQKWFPTIGEMSPEMTAAICAISIAFAVRARIKAEETKKLENESPKAA